MTTIDYAATAPATSRASGRASRAARTLFNAPSLFLKRRFIALQTRNELAGLSDRQLDDIGLSRSDIDGVSRDMAARTAF